MTTRAHIIVLGNEKGGSGKSTTAMHLVAGLLRMGLSVGCVDLDLRQRTFSRYLENRERTAKAHKGALPCPRRVEVARSAAGSLMGAVADETERLKAALRDLIDNCDAVVVDTPGSDSHLGTAVLSYADTLITPINDSFVDLDVLARVDPETHRIAGLSHYAETVFEERKKRAARDGGSIDWIVVRNRLSHLDARNKQAVEAALSELSGRIGFRTVPGMGERVIYRELFPKGLTMMDLVELGDEGREEGLSLSMSAIAARQEIRALIEAIRLKGRP